MGYSVNRDVCRLWGLCPKYGKTLYRDMKTLHRDYCREGECSVGFYVGVSIGFCYMGYYIMLNNVEYLGYKGKSGNTQNWLGLDLLCRTG